MIPKIITKTKQQSWESVGGLLPRVAQPFHHQGPLFTVSLCEACVYLSDMRR